jgi:GNAT superfamily N-acetyltransferase
VADGITVRAFTDAELTAVARISVAAGQSPTGSGADPVYLGRRCEAGRVAVAVSGSGAVLGWGAVTAAAHGEILSDLFVDAAARGRGVGAAILGRLWPQPAGTARFTSAPRTLRRCPSTLARAWFPCGRCCT